MKAKWRAYTELADGHKMYICKYGIQGQHHHTTNHTEAEQFTTDQKHKLKLKGYFWERVLKNGK